MVGCVDRRDASPQVIAHRGASAYAPEHSFAAYDLALAQGADVLELDVRMTADGELVVLHDATLLRTAGERRAVARVSAAQLAALDVAVRPPTLTAVLDRYATAAGWLVELKDPTPALERGVATALVARGLQRSAVVQSFDAAALRRLRRAEPSLVVSPLLWRVPSTRRLRSIAAYAPSVGVRHGCVDIALVLRAQAQGLVVRAWTANAPREIARLVGLGVDGIVTDVPDRARAVVDGARLRGAA
jgi:glycerophosphoryl diester phosphodiesterase